MRLRRDLKEYRQIIAALQLRVQAVGAFHNIQPGDLAVLGRCQRHGAAVKGAVFRVFTAAEGNQNLSFQPLPVQIAAGLGVARGGPLLRTKEEIVSVEQHRIGINRCQQICQSAFAAGGAALNGQ